MIVSWAAAAVHLQLAAARCWTVVVLKAKHSHEQHSDGPAVCLVSAGVGGTDVKGHPSSLMANERRPGETGPSLVRNFTSISIQDNALTSYCCQLPEISAQKPMNEKR